MLCLPTEEQLRIEIEKERTLIEATVEDQRLEGTAKERKWTVNKGKS